MPTRILLRLFLLAGLAAPLCAFALGIGPLEVRSALNQNFEAEIPLIINNPAELTGLTVRIPRQQDFDRTGVERLEFLSKLRFSVQASPGGPSFIRITSIEPIREPSFNLLVEVTWSRGRLLREFPVQLDPELYANRRQPAPLPAPVVAPPPVVAKPAAPPPTAAPGLPPAPPVSFEGAQFYGPVKPGETLMAIANRVRPSTAINLPQMMSILVAGNPEAFTNSNPATLRTGAILKVPTPQALGVRGGPTPVPVPPTPELAAAPAPAPAPAAETVAPAVPVSLPPAATVAPGVAPVPTPSLPIAAPTVPSVAPGAPPTTTIPPAAESRPPAPSPSSTDQPREIFPQGSIPQATTPPAPAAQPETPSAAVQPEAAAAAKSQPEAAAAAKPQPEAAKPSPAPKPSLAETESGWWANPVVWIAILLIVLAVGAVLLLPLIRRPARPKPAVDMEGVRVEPGGSTAVPASTGEPAAALPITRTQLREPQSRRPIPAAAPVSIPVERAAEPAPKPTPKPAPKPTVAPPPKPIEELLKDIDFGLEDRPLPAAGGKGAAPSLKLETKQLPDVEPSTASITRGPSPLAPAPTAKAETPSLSQSQDSPQPQTESPSELRLDSLDFDFGDLDFEKTSRSSTNLPPLEMKPAAPGPKPADLPPLKLGDHEPPIRPPVTPAAPSASDLKFEFTDITREAAKTGAREDLLKLEEDLRGFGGDATLNLGEVDASSLGGDDRAIGADYVETKLDLATTFMDMGDQMGARGLLEDVLREGDALQKKRAGELLKKLG